MTPMTQILYPQRGYVHEYRARTLTAHTRVYLMPDRPTRLAGRPEAASVRERRGGREPRAKGCSWPDGEMHLRHPRNLRIALVVVSTG